MRQFCLFLLFYFMSVHGNSQQVKALVIGIDTYSPPEGKNISIDNDRTLFPDLQGCKNDAVAIRAVLETYYKIAPGLIDSLFNRDATRENIINKTMKLLESCKPNDYAFFYYAGHGSQVKNSLSSEQDKKDETIVPSDAWTRAGMDITDKELSRIFNLFIDKGVHLTVVFDCCHSGSLSRAPVFDVPSIRYIKESNFDTKDAVGILPPEQRTDGDFLIISAAQDNESAVEQYDPNGLPHGAFTIALLQAINQQTASASIDNLFQSARAILKMNGLKQEPVLAGSLVRRAASLTGENAKRETVGVMIPVIGVSRDMVELGGGFAQDLYPGNELLAILAGNDSITLRVDSVISITNSLASVIRGDKSRIVSGQLFTINNWVSKGAALLKVYLPENPFSELEIQKIISIAKKIKQRLPGQWIDDLSKEDPTISFFFMNGQCWMNRYGDKLELLKRTDPEIFIQFIGKKKFYFDIPFSPTQASIIKNRLAGNANIEIVKKSTGSQYVLYGGLNHQNRLVYGWRKTDPASRDSLEVMPVQTRSYLLQELNETNYIKTADSLAQLAARLSRISGWLQLNSPKTEDIFPYHLELRHQSGVGSSAPLPYRLEDKVSLHLVEEPNSSGKSIKRKFVYSFVIDKEGTMTLLYPDPAKGNVENRFPRPNEGARLADVELNRFQIGWPTGTDTYFMLATDEPIQQYGTAFNQKGVRAVNPVEEKNPMAAIINTGNENKSRSISRTPKNWVLKRLFIKSVY